MKPAVRTLAATSILLTVACVVRQTGDGQTQRPNVLLIVSDDLGYADIGIYGSRDIPTPNIDRVAQEGIRFTNAYVSGPYCSPSRAGLMTGRYPQRFGYEFNPDGSPDYGLPLTETTMADRLKAAGYRTALFGKWHLGSADRLHPMRRGFEEFYGFLGADHSYVNVAGIDVGTNMPDPLVDGMKPASSVSIEGGVLLSGQCLEHAVRRRQPRVPAPACSSPRRTLVLLLLCDRHHAGDGHSARWRWLRVRGRIVDAQKQPMDGSKAYKLHLPPNIPAKQFWSLVLYDTQTRSMLQTDQQFPSIGSQKKGIAINPDTSVDVYFRPTSPSGKESNWVQTWPGKGWTVILRLYGPLQPFFDKTWRPGEFEELK